MNNNGIIRFLGPSYYYFGLNVRNELDSDAVILYKVDKRFFMLSVSARSTASVLRVFTKKVKFTVFGIKARTFESVFLNNEKALYFITKRKKQYNDVIIRRGMLRVCISFFSVFSPLLLYFFS